MLHLGRRTSYCRRLSGFHLVTSFSKEASGSQGNPLPYGCHGMVGTKMLGEKAEII